MNSDQGYAKNPKDFLEGGARAAGITDDARLEPIAKDQNGAIADRPPFSPFCSFAIGFRRATGTGKITGTTASLRRLGF